MIFQPELRTGDGEATQALELHEVTAGHRAPLTVRWRSQPVQSCFVGNEIR